MYTKIECKNCSDHVTGILNGATKAFQKCGHQDFEGDPNHGIAIQVFDGGRLDECPRMECLNEFGLRMVEITLGKHTGEFAFFHEWTECGNRKEGLESYAILELENGQSVLIVSGGIKFKVKTKLDEKNLS